MRTASSVRTFALGAIAAGLLAVALPGSAQAAPVDEFLVCWESDEAFCGHWTTGIIDWSNRTARVTGEVGDGGVPDPGYTVAVFEAFAGSTKIESQTRSANRESDLGQVRGFNFTIGDPDLYGGINRIKITVCRMHSSAGYSCGSSENYSKS